MKKVFKNFSLLFLSFLALSCNNESEGGEVSNRKAPKEIIDVIKKNDNQTYRFGGVCDGAVSIGISVETDFDIKRPKFDCNSGFWFCTETHTYLTCKDGAGNIIHQEEICRTGNTNQKPHKYQIPLYEFDENNIVLSFKKEYFKVGFTADDLKFFSVDDERLILPNRKLVIGEYEVFDNESTYVVKVKTKNI